MNLMHSIPKGSSPVAGGRRPPESRFNISPGSRTHPERDASAVIRPHAGSRGHRTFAHRWHASGMRPRESVGVARDPGVIRPLATFDDPFGIVGSLAFGEVVRIHTLHLIDLGDGNADVMVDHEFGQFISVDEDDLAVVHASGEFDGIFGEEEVVMKMPLVALLPASAPANCCTSGLPTVLSFQRFA